MSRILETGTTLMYEDTVSRNIPRYRTLYQEHQIGLREAGATRT